MAKTSPEQSFDVLVAGGGMAGIAAAIAAARTGARTALVEKAGWLGGTGITGATGLRSFYHRQYRVGLSPVAWSVRYPGTYQATEAGMSGTNNFISSACPTKPPLPL